MGSHQLRVLHKALVGKWETGIFSRMNKRIRILLTKSLHPNSSYSSEMV